MILNTFNFGERRPGPITGGKAWLRLVARPDALLVLLRCPGLHAGSPGPGPSGRAGPPRQAGRQELRAPDGRSRPDGVRGGSNARGPPR